MLNGNDEHVHVIVDLAAASFSGDTKNRVGYEVESVGRADSNAQGKVEERVLSNLRVVEFELEVERKAGNAGEILARKQFRRTTRNRDVDYFDADLGIRRDCFALL